MSLCGYISVVPYAKSQKPGLCHALEKGHPLVLSQAYFSRTKFCSARDYAGLRNDALVNKEVAREYVVYSGFHFK